VKVRVAYTAEVNNAQRILIAWYNDGAGAPGQARLALREEVQDFFESLGYDNGLGVLSDLEVQYENAAAVESLNSNLR
jgi:hypothetical protein